MDVRQITALSLGVKRLFQIDFLFIFLKFMKEKIIFKKVKFQDNVKFIYLYIFQRYIQDIKTII